ncbi:MAG: ClbS/DfsB family four-helix bundle protein [Chloroflexi bacterium]|nr:MAG: ClbS/DfsB family four-helix bundle protein [Chloroflexota bacterium]
METVLRESLIDRLNNSWGPYIARFQSLSAAEQSVYLQKQGYQSFPALLAHIIAWWQDGTRVIEQMRLESTMPLPDYNVDEFNARAVRDFEGCSEGEVIQAFETQRQALLVLVNELPDCQLCQENINTRLYYEILMHWSEHSLSQVS